MDGAARRGVAALTEDTGGAERQLAAPRSGSLGRVGADVEDVVGARRHSVDQHVRAGRVGRPVVGRAASVVVEQLVDDDPAVSVSSDRRVPLQVRARRAGAASREVVRRARRYCAHAQVTRHHRNQHLPLSSTASPTR